MQNMAKPWNEIDLNAVKLLDAEIKVIEEHLILLKTVVTKIRSKYSISERDQVINDGRF